MKPFYFGFDGLDVSFQGRIPRDLVEALDRAKEEAQASRAAVLVEWRGQSMHVAETGARGGYAYRCDTGPEGAVWFFSSNESADNWNIRVSVKSAWLATAGYQAVKAGIYEFLWSIGADVKAESVARVDFAMDFRGDDLDGFVLDPTAFVMHSHTTRADHAEDVQIHGISGRYTSVTCGKMPGRQIIVYDKTREISAHRKAEWPVIWGDALARAGREPLREGERVWRVEIRAGKDHLKGRWGCSTWLELEAMAGDIFTRALEDIRLTEPNHRDSERHRWGDAPLWEAARECVKGELFAWFSGVQPGVIKLVKREQLAMTMRAMMLGLLATWTYATATPAKAETIAPALAGMASEYLDADHKEFSAKMKRAGKKYRFLAVEDVNGRIDCEVPCDFGRGGESPDVEGGQGYRGGTFHPGHADRHAQPLEGVGGAE